MYNQGVNSQDVFHGRGAIDAVKEFYAKSAPLFADIVRKNLKSGKYTLADLGGHKGELLNDILSLLPEYVFESIVVDRVDGIEAGLNARKIVADIVDSNIPDKSIDLVIMRYVLPWDAYVNQKNILAEAGRICRGFAIIQHQGAPDDNPRPLQDASLRLWSGAVPTLKRAHGFFTEAKKVEDWMQELGIVFEKIDQRNIKPLSGMFIEKFQLSPTEAEATKNILSGCDGITITTWLLRFEQNT